MADTPRPIRLRINGEAREFAAAPRTIAELLAQLGIGTRHVAVEQNRTLVPKRAFETTLIAADDVFEIVTLVGGG